MGGGEAMVNGKYGIESSIQRGDQKNAGGKVFDYGLNLGYTMVELKVGVSGPGPLPFDPIAYRKWRFRQSGLSGGLVLFGYESSGGIRTSNRSLTHGRAAYDSFSNESQ